MKIITFISKQMLCYCIFSFNSSFCYPKSVLRMIKCVGKSVGKNFLIINDDRRLCLLGGHFDDVDGEWSIDLC